MKRPVGSVMSRPLGALSLVSRGMLLLLVVRMKRGRNMKSRGYKNGEGYKVRFERGGVCLMMKEQQNMIKGKKNFDG